MTFYYLITYFAVILAAFGQIMLKLGASTSGTKMMGVLHFNLWVLAGLCAMFFSMLLTVRALSVIPLRDMSFIIPTIYILVPILSRIFLKERLSRKTILGTIILISGIILFNIPIKNSY